MQDTRYEHFNEILKAKFLPKKDLSLDDYMSYVEQEHSLLHEPAVYLLARMSNTQVCIIRKLSVFYTQKRCI